MIVCPHCGKPYGKARRMSVSVPRELAAFARETARRRGATVSSVVAEAVETMRDSERSVSDAP